MKKLCLLMAILLALALPLSGCAATEADTGKNISVFDEFEADANEDYLFSDTGESEITVNKANSADTKSEAVTTQTTAETTEKKTTAQTTSPVSTTAKPSAAKKQTAEAREITSDSKAEKTTEKKTTKQAETTKKEKETTAQTAGQDDQSDMVWIPNSGSKYHRSASCSGMKNPSHVSLSTAKARGYTPCKKCYK